MRMASEDRRRQLPWVVLGLTITLTAAIIFALWASSLSSRTAVAVAGRDIPTGSKIEVDDLRAVEVASGQGAGFVPMTELDSVVGHTVRSPIPEGTILNPGLLSESSPVGLGMAIVGAVLQPGEYPITHLGPGQPVGIVITGESPVPDAESSNGRLRRGAFTGISSSTTRATVAEVSEVLESGQEALFVSLLASADDAVLIGKAAASEELRLILLPGDSPSTSGPSDQRATVGGAVR